MDKDKPKRTKRKDKEKTEAKNSLIGGALAIISIVVLLLVVKFFPGNDQMVKGLATDMSENKDIQKLEAERQAATENVKQTVDERLESVKEEISNLNAADMTAPRVEKIIRDLESIQDIPKNQAKNACLRVCETFD